MNMQIADGRSCSTCVSYQAAQGIFGEEVGCTFLMDNSTHRGVVDVHNPTRDWCTQHRAKEPNLFTECKGAS